MEKKNTWGGARPGAGKPKGVTGPYKEKIKEARVAMRLSDEEAQMLNECVEKLKCSKTQVVVKALKLLYDTLEK